jgi:ABC-type glycerol-3-phosphate transport system substrate-binding protein
MAQENSLVIWSHWASEQIKIDFMNAVLKAFKETHGIDVTIVWMEKPELKEKLVFALDTPEPDITYVDGGFTHPRLWQQFSDLGEIPITGETNPSWAFGNLGKGKNNYLPLEGASSAIYYNRQLFKRAGIKVPHDRPVTTKEFLDIIRKLRAAGITPVGEGTADRDWKIGMPILSTIFRFAGPEKLGQLLKGEINFSDPDIVAALNFWKQVVNAQAYDPEKALALNLSEGIYEMTDGRAAMNFCGTWIYSKFGTTERDRGQVGVLDWFTAENGKGNDVYEIAWVAGYGINRNSRHLPEAKKFFEFLLTPLAASFWMKHVQAPYPVFAEETSTEGIYAQLASLRSSQSPVLLNFHFFNFSSKAVNNMWKTESQKFITGHRSVDKFIKNMNSRMQ